MEPFVQVQVVAGIDREAVELAVPDTLNRAHDGAGARADPDAFIPGGNDMEIVRGQRQIELAQGAGHRQARRRPCLRER